MNSTTASAGWYPDPEIQGSLRLWNGESWTESRAPMPASPTREPRTAERFHNLAYFVLWLNIIGAVFVFLFLASEA